MECFVICGFYVCLVRLLKPMECLLIRFLVTSSIAHGIVCIKAKLSWQQFLCRILIGGAGSSSFRWRSSSGLLIGPIAKLNRITRRLSDCDYETWSTCGALLTISTTSPGQSRVVDEEDTKGGAPRLGNSYLSRPFG